MNILHTRLSNWYLNIHKKMVLVIQSLWRLIWRKVLKNLLEQIFSRCAYKDQMFFCQKIQSLFGSNFTVEIHIRNDFLENVRL